MDFWLQEEANDDIVATQDADEQGLRCVTCGGTDFYHDEATGTEICSSCFTQSQQLNEEVEEEDAVAQLVSKNFRGRRSLLGNAKRERKDKRALETWDSSSPLPDLATCLDGMRMVLKKSLKILVADLLGMKREQQAAANEVAKHLFVSYVQSWGEGAEHYAKICPEIRFSLRDLFLPSLYVRYVNLVLLEKAVEQIKSTDENIKIEKGDMASEEQDEAASDPSMALPCREKGRNQASQRPVPSRSFVEIMRLVLEGEPNSMGRMEAALMLKPSMVLVASILWLSVARSGVAPYRIFQWVLNGDLPLQNAFELSLNSTMQQKLRAVHSKFRMESIVSPRTLEHYGALLLFAAGMESLESFAGARILTFRGFRRLQMMSEAAIPVAAAQLVADMGLGQTVLDMTLSLLDMNGYSNGPRLKCVSYKNIDSISDVAALIMCAVELRPDWRSFILQWYRKHSKNPNGTTGDGFVPWTEEHFRLMTNGSFEGYLKFCEDNLTRCNKKAKISVMPDSFAGDLKNSAIETHEDNVESVRPCPHLAGVQLPTHRHRKVASQTPSALQSRILFLLNTKRKWEKVPRCGFFPYLDEYELLLLEFLAYSTQTKPMKIQKALINILAYKRPEELLCV